MTTMPATLKESIIRSRLGSCWKCMSFAAGMLVVSVVAILMVGRWQDLEAGDREIPLVAEIAFTSTCLFTALCLAHLVTLVLRKTAWRAG